MSSLPVWAQEVEEHQMKCKHCGNVITVATALGMLFGENGSYYCDRGDQLHDQLHELQTN